MDLGRISARLGERGGPARTAAAVRSCLARTRAAHAPEAEARRRLRLELDYQKNYESVPWTREQDEAAQRLAADGRGSEEIAAQLRAQFGVSRTSEALMQRLRKLRRQGVSWLDGGAPAPVADSSTAMDGLMPATDTASPLAALEDLPRLDDLEAEMLGDPSWWAGLADEGEEEEAWMAPGPSSASILDSGQLFTGLL